MNVFELFKPQRILPQAEIALRQREHCEKRIKEVATEAKGYLDELANHPMDIPFEMLDDLHKCLGSLEALALTLHGYPERDPDLENARERADEADRRAAERDRG